MNFSSSVERLIAVVSVESDMNNCAVTLLLAQPYRIIERLWQAEPAKGVLRTSYAVHDAL